MYDQPKICQPFKETIEPERNILPGNHTYVQTLHSIEFGFLDECSKIITLA